MPMLWMAVSKIFLTSSFWLQLFKWITLFQFSFTTAKLGIESIGNSFIKSGARSASIFTKGTLCYALSCYANGSSNSLFGSCLFMKSRTAIPPPSYNTDWILAFDFAVVFMTSIVKNETIYIIVFFLEAYHLGSILPIKNNQFWGASVFYM